MQMPGNGRKNDTELHWRCTIHKGGDVDTSTSQRRAMGVDCCWNIGAPRVTKRLQRTERPNLLLVIEELGNTRAAIVGSTKGRSDVGSGKGRGSIGD